MGAGMGTEVAGMGTEVAAMEAEGTAKVAMEVVPEGMAACTAE